MDHLTFAFWSPGWLEYVVIAIVAVLLFGKRLPEIGRSLGRTLVNFKKGVGEMQNEIQKASAEVEHASKPSELESKKESYDKEEDSQYDKGGK